MKYLVIDIVNCQLTITIDRRVSFNTILSATTQTNIPTPNTKHYRSVTNLTHSKNGNISIYIFQADSHVPNHSMVYYYYSGYK